jgi:hypothetical protein
MSDLAAILPNQPQALAKTSSNPKLERVTGKVRVAIEAMVWDGLPRDKAAEKAGISEHGLYKALRKPPVKAAYLAELDVLRTSERARNIHTLTEVRDQTSNQMARVQAVKALEQIDGDEAQTGNRTALPGMQIVIVQAGSNAPHLVVEHGAQPTSLIGNQPSD